MARQWRQRRQVKLGSKLGLPDKTELIVSQFFLSNERYGPLKTAHCVGTQSHLALDSRTTTRRTGPVRVPCDIAATSVTTAIASSIATTAIGTIKRSLSQMFMSRLSCASGAAILRSRQQGPELGCIKTAPAG